MRVLDIVAGTSVDGPGLRTSIYFAGCSHHCPGCHNPQSWDPLGGSPMTPAQILEVVEREGFNVTLSGGDPLQQPPSELIELLQGIRALGLNVWAYTGYTFEQLARRHDLAPVLDLIDTIVDGPFVEALRDPALPFRGSSNQRIIPLR